MLVLHPVPSGVGIHQGGEGFWNAGLKLEPLRHADEAFDILVIECDAEVKVVRRSGDPLQDTRHAAAHDKTYGLTGECDQQRKETVINGYV